MHLIFISTKLLSKNWVHAALFTVALIYALTFSWAKDVMPKYIHAFGFIVIRVWGAALLFFIASLFTKKERINLKEHGGRLLLCSVFGVMANMLMFFKGLEITTPINGAVLMLATPIFVFILSVLINKNKVYYSQVFGILLACFGCFWLMSGRAFHFSSTTLPGDILIILNAISYAGYLVLAKKLLQTYHFITVSKYTFFIGGLMVLPFGYGELSTAHFALMDTEIVLKVLFIIICSTFITYLLNAWCIMKAGPTIVGAYIYLQPILATLIAILLQKDSLDLHKIISSVLIFTGVYITSTKFKWQLSKA